MTKKIYFCLFMCILFFLCGCAQIQEVKSNSSIFYQPSKIVPLEVKGALKEEGFMTLLFDMPNDVSVSFTTEVWQKGVKVKSYVNKWPPDSESDSVGVDSYYSQSISLYADNIAYINAGVASSTGSCLSWSDPIELIEMTGYSYKIYEKGFNLNRGEKKAISVFLVNNKEEANYTEITQEQWDEDISKLLGEADFVIVCYVETK